MVAFSVTCHFQHAFPAIAAEYAISCIPLRHRYRFHPSDLMEDKNFIGPAAIITPSSNAGSCDAEQEWKYPFFLPGVNATVLFHHRSKGGIIPWLVHSSRSPRSCLPASCQSQPLDGWFQREHPPQARDTILRGKEVI